MYYVPHANFPFQISHSSVTAKGMNSSRGSHIIFHHRLKHWTPSLFWGVTRRRSSVSYRRFGTAYRPHPQGSSSPRTTAVTKYQPTPSKHPGGAKATTTTKSVVMYIIHLSLKMFHGSFKILLRRLQMGVETSIRLSD